MQIGGVMRVKLVTASPDDSAAAAIQQMIDAGVGSVVVCDGPSLVGIFTERDVLRRVVGERRNPDTTRVAEVMTRDLVVMRN